MKDQFLLFGRKVSNTLGGWNDLIGSFPTKKAAENEVNLTLPFVEWWHIVSLKTGKIVKEQYRTAEPAKEQK